MRNNKGQVNFLAKTKYSRSCSWSISPAVLAAILAITGLSGCSGLTSAKAPAAAAPVAPSITTQPASQTVTTGQTATFTVAATGTSPLSYQWRKNSVAIAGATSSSYTTPATTSSDNGAQFTVMVSNAVGNATSNAAALTVNLLGISGSISPAGNGAGATVALSGAAAASTTADGSGNYSFTGLSNGAYAVTPSKTGFNFSPGTQSVTINGATVTGINFTATAVTATFTISGTISPASLGAGSTLTLSGTANLTTTADASGNYSFTSLTNGSYTVTPSGQNVTFSPTSQPVTINNANAASVNFTATASARVIFFDDFNGTTLGPEWVAMNRHGDYSNSELQCYLPANVSIANSLLSIVSQVQTQTCGDSTHAPSQWNYTSGMVQWKSFNFTYGTVEFRAKMAGGQGPWPAVWMLGANCQASNVLTADNVGTCNWPQPGSDEIDITEIKNADQKTVWQNVISGSSGFQSCTPTTTDVSQNWHTYDLIWAPGSLTWQIDGTTTCHISNSIPSMPMFLIINTAIGGGGGPVNSSTLPQTTAVDYVKITQ